MMRGVSSAIQKLVEGAAAAEAARRAQREVPLLVVDRVTDVGMLIVVLRQQHRRAEEDRMAPPFRQDLALHLDPLDHARYRPAARSAG